jgi:formylglycine-generating enzyme required for sulfatase activity
VLMQLPAFTNSAGMVMVKISPALWAGRYEVTQQEYQKVAGGNPSQFQNPNNPVDSVSWNDSMNFCKVLTEAERKAEMLPPNFVYSLPTQSQWESLVADADAKDAAMSVGPKRSGTATVGSLGPNSPGLYDIRGNLWEFCLDPQDKPYRVLRGGAWDTFTEINARIDFRWYANGLDDKKNVYGFRCVMGASAAQ